MQLGNSDRYKEDKDNDLAFGYDDKEYQNYNNVFEDSMKSGLGKGGWIMLGVVMLWVGMMMFMIIMTK